jgi:hypothetical protein
VNTYLTDPLDPDTDADLIWDGFEINSIACLDPLLPDASLDADSDGLANVHEFFNSALHVSDPCDAFSPRPGAPGGGYFGEFDGDLVIGVPDLNALKAKLGGWSPDFSRCFPADPLIQDLDGNGEIGVPDLNLLKQVLGGAMTDFIAGSPTEIMKVEPADGVTVAEGETVAVRVRLSKDLAVARPGFGIVFRVVSGSATLFGGEGTASGGRYDLTDLNGEARMVLRVDAAGAIEVEVELPYDSEVHTRQLFLPGNVEINGI